MSAGEQQPNPGPLEHALLMVAQDLMSGVIDDLTPNATESYEARMERIRNSSPELLFGALALRLGGVDLEPNASTPDRARGIAESLKRIMTTPELFEAITNAPFVQGLVPDNGPSVVDSQHYDEEEAQAAQTLRKIVAQNGFLSREMVSERAIQLRYGADQTRLGRFGKARLAQEGNAAVITLAPLSNASWNVKTYKYHDQYGFRQYIKSYQVSLTDLFTMLAVAFEGTAVRNLTNITGKPVRVGRVITGTQLKIEHTFIRDIQEVPGHETDIRYQTIKLPYTLRQAYLGTSTNYPLF